MHGTRDDTVPFDQGERLHRALEQAGATTRFIPIEGDHHNLRGEPDLPYDEQVWDNLLGEQTIKFFDHHLRQ